MRLLQILSIVFWGVGNLGSGILLLYVEWTYLRHNFVQIFNPFLQLQVLGTLLSIPLSWIFLGMTVLGHYAVESVEQRLNRSNQQPKPTPKQVVSNSRVQSSIPTPPPAPAQPLRTDTSTRQRPYIQCRIDQLERIADAEWNNKQLLSKINHELESRRSWGRPQALRERITQRLTQLHSTQFVRTTTATFGSQDLSSDVFRYSEGLLSHCGYEVGANGLPESQRRQILDSVFLERLPFVNDTAYLGEWGEPGTSQRLQKSANCIAAFARNARRRNSGNLSNAIQEWEADLAYLKQTYYNGRFHFPWPQTGI
ncbi:hypothetical protein JOY44_06635 [Phormidium sp. CLA17]|uniref:hypothetical protein n=1 Tax=Leptolyngbya sp. Cla-17 TaxID=2803751 RepID=UPI0014928B34|nr:hypothetical protein [Leptolyngbya sp. Cla-17]MBM0741297.1 hypothetical protein [Leptolyngbya sp. Cla-17]